MKKILFIFLGVFLIIAATAAYTLTEVDVDRATREVNVTFWDRAKELMRAVRKKPKIGIDGELVNKEDKTDGSRDQENSYLRDY